MLEEVEVDEQDREVLALAARVLDRRRQRGVQVAVVVEVGQVVALGQLLRLPAVERVLHRDRDVVGEDLEQVLVLRAVEAGLLPVEQLEHAADLVGDADRHRHHRAGAVLGLGVDAWLEEGVLDDVVGVVRRTGGVNVPGDPLRRDGSAGRRSTSRARRTRR